MSSLSASLCLFSAALCNVAVLDQKLFEQPEVQQGTIHNQQAANQQGLLGAATNLLGGLTAGLGGLSGTTNNNQAQGHPPRTPHQSPCGKKFQYITNGKVWKGVIKLKNVDVNHATNLEAEFIIPQQTQRRNSYGKIELVNQEEKIYDDISNGIPLLFEVAFASQNPVPKLVAIYKNKKEICSGPIESTSGVTSFRLKYHLEAPVTSLNGESELGSELPLSKPDAPKPKPDSPKPKPSGSNQQLNQFQDDNSVCGTPVAGFTQSLVIGGQAAGHGEWPWLTAFYRSKDGNLEFICGGSLISSTYTLTAAHCIQDKGRDEPMQTQNALLFIGKHNLIQWNEEGFEKKGAKSFKVHPDWNPEEIKYDADLALIEMDSPVKYSKFIRPVCLWNGPAEIEKIVGQNGVVVGWGKNDQGKLNTDFPKKVNVPIVSDGQCLRTHEAFVHITSERTFCAGGRMGEGPCQGDSGGGLVIKISKKWFIRGIVSASLRDGTSCDVNSFAIFTDIVKFLPWIKGEMKAY